MRQAPFIILALVLLLPSCGGSSAIPSSSLESLGTSNADYKITFKDSHYQVFHNAHMSYKLDRSGTRWLSVNFPFTEMQYKSDNVIEIRHIYSDHSTIVNPASVPLHISTFVTANPLCTVTPLGISNPSAVQPNCSGGSDCDILDGNCVNTNGDCVYSTPCGANSTDSSGMPNGGVGVGYVGFGIDGMGCTIDFSTMDIECDYLDAGPSNFDPNLFLYDVRSVSSWGVTCENPASWGWVVAQYVDAEPATGSHLKFLGGGPGVNSWVYPTDFVSPFGNRPPTYPVYFEAHYFKFGSWAHLWPEKQGHCIDAMASYP